MHWSRKNFVKTVMGEPSVDQGNLPVLLLVRCGDPAVWTTVDDVSTAVQLHMKTSDTV